MKLRLFAIRDLSTGRIVPDLFFPSKPDAKAKRDEMGITAYCVTYGPDHHAYRG